MANLTDGGRSLIFLVCSERSGSNLFARLLGAHPRACSPAPAHLFRIVGDNLERYGDLTETASWHALVEDVQALFESMFGEWRLKPDWEAYRRVPAEQRSAAGLVAALHLEEARLGGRDLVVLKENQSYRYLPFILATLPHARWAFAVRDPRDMALSWKRAGALRGGAVRASDVWLADQQGLLKARAWLGSAAGPLMRYEDLITDPDRVLDDAFRALGMEPAPGLHERFHLAEGVQKDAEAIYDWRNLKQPLMRDNAGGFLTGLEPDELRLVEARCGELMRVFGYRPHTDATAEEADELVARLAPLEPMQKPAWSGVSETEQRRRAARQKALEQIARRGLPAVFGR